MGKLTAIAGRMYCPYNGNYAEEIRLIEKFT